MRPTFQRTSPLLVPGKYGYLLPNVSTLVKFGVIVAVLVFAFHMVTSQL